MFKKLHLQMTFFCTMVTSLIIIALSCVCLYISETGLIKNSYTTFLNEVSSIVSNLETQTIITQQWVSQVKKNGQFILEITDNGGTLLTNLLHQTENESKLLKKTADMALNEHGLDISQPSASSVVTEHVEFDVSDATGQYNASVAIIPKSNGYLSVIILHSLRSQKTQITIQRLLIIAADILTIILLSFFSWHFTKRMIQPIQISQDKQAQFIAAASHELRSPLAVILSCVSALKNAPPKTAERFAMSIESEGQRMSHLVDDMLTLANADAHSWRTHFDKVELDTLLLETFEKYECLSQKKGITLAIKLPDDNNGTCSCDRERIAQVLSILLDNALSYTPKGGMIRMNLSSLGNKSELSIIDDGPGIPNEDKGQIFERFYRIDSAHNDKEHFGLGLCIAKEIVKLHKGKIFVTDTNGGGATFTIILPNIT